MIEQGGFGRFQFFAVLIIILGLNSNGWEEYNLSYFLLYPEFECKENLSGNWTIIYPDSLTYTEKCNPDYFCSNNDVTYTYVESS